MEIPTYESAYHGTRLPAEQTATADRFLRVWEKRHLSHDLVEYRFATTILEISKKRIAGEPVDLSAYRKECE